jgi:hypothetical protein
VTSEQIRDSWHLQLEKQKFLHEGSSRGIILYCSRHITEGFALSCVHNTNIHSGLPPLLYFRSPLKLTRKRHTSSLATMPRLFKFRRKLNYDGYLVADTLLIVTSYALFGCLISKIPDTPTNETKMVTLPGGVDVPAERLAGRKDEGVKSRLSRSDRRRIWRWMID